MTIFLYMFAAFVCILAVSLEIDEIILFYKMRNKEKRLRAIGVVPSGSTLRHGMVYNKKTGEIKSTESPSLAWYRKLIS